MSANTGKRLYTADDLLAMDEDEPYELIRGELRLMEPPPGRVHDLVAANLIITLGHYVRERALGLVIGPAGVLLTRDPDTVRAPDLCFVRADRVPRDGFGPGYSDVAPDLAVEVLSPSNRPREIKEKLEQYFDAGVRVAWVIDPHRRTVTVHTPGERPRVVQEHETLDGGDVVPGFRCAVAELFVGVRRDL